VTTSTYVWKGSTDSRFFSTETEAYNFAKARAISGNPGSSLFRRKPSNDCSVSNPCASIDNQTSHAGGTPWPNPSTGYTAATNWINGGLSARNILPRLLPWHEPADGAIIARIRPAPVHLVLAELDIPVVPGR
jgi:hypothetical protein